MVDVVLREGADTVKESFCLFVFFCLFFTEKHLK